MQGTTNKTRKCMPTRRRRAAPTPVNLWQRGLTLIELLVVVGILGVLASLAAPSFQGMLLRQRLQGSAAEMVTDLQYARSEAVARNHSMRISFHHSDDGTCYLLHTGATADCSCASDGTAQCTSPAVSLKSVGFAASRGVSLAANVTYILFDPVRGTASPAGTITVTASDGSIIKHIVNIMGRTRSCSPNGAAGLKPC